jgi:hypothetical protein
LLECAIAIPVLIAILYYLHDVPKAKRIQAKLDFCACCGVNMFQNVSAGRIDKKVKIQDLKYISCVLFHPYFIGVGHYTGASSNNSCFGHILLCYVKGVGENRAVMKWQALNNFGQVPPARQSIVVKSGHAYNYVTVLNGDIGTEYNASSIYKDLKIKNGEVKMILDVMLWTDSKPKSASFWGFYVFNPKKDRTSGYFHSVVIFTPKPGLFDENTPPN